MDHIKEYARILAKQTDDAMTYALNEKGSMTISYGDTSFVITDHKIVITEDIKHINGKFDNSPKIITNPTSGSFDIIEISEDPTFVFESYEDFAEAIYCGLLISKQAEKYLLEHKLEIMGL